MSIDQKALENINAHLAQLETRSDGAQAAEKHYFEILRALLEYEGFDVRTDQHGLEHLDLNATSRCEPYIRIGAEFKHYQSQGLLTRSRFVAYSSRQGEPIAIGLSLSQIVLSRPRHTGLPHKKSQLTSS
jgi:hypothetical protein